MSSTDAATTPSVSAAAEIDIMSVADETKIFWLQRFPESTAAPPLLSEQPHCPLPTIDALLATVAPFADLARRNTECLSAFAPQLVQRRDALWAAKQQMDGIEDEAYMRIRDKLFPLARSGAMSAEVGNRAAHKLLESMDASGISERFFGQLQSVVQYQHPHGRYNKNFPNRNNNSYAKREAAAQDHLKQQQQQQQSDDARESKQVRARPKELVFVDVCGGPGSFAQALLCAVKKPPKMTVRGYGMTLDTRETVPELVWYPKLVRRRDFTPCFGLDGTGSVYAPENVEALCSLCVNESRLLLVVGDGGFKVKDEAIQEAATAQLVYAQWYMALRLLREGGALVLKLFETSSVFLRSMLTLSCLFFSHVAIVKPAHSRCVNSERYLSCWGFRRASLTQGWLEYLEDVHSQGFATEGAAPFTLLPNIDLNPHAARQQIEPLRSILVGIEESIVVTATRQTIALGRVFAEYNKRRLNKEAAEAEGGEDAAVEGRGGGRDDDENAEGQYDDGGDDDAGGDDNGE